MRVEIDFNDPTVWANMVADKTAITSNSKETLNKAIYIFLAGLHKRYLDNTSPVFPSQQEYTKLLDLCMALAQLLGVKKLKSLDSLLIAINRIQNRYSKIKLLPFIDGILAKLLKLEVPPKTTIFNAIQKCGEQDGETKAALQQIFGVLESTAFQHRLDSHPWEKWLDVIRPLNFGPAHTRTQQEKEEFDKAFQDHKRVFAYFAFMDLIRQQSLWMRLYSAVIRPSVRWIGYVLMREGDIANLRKIVHGTDGPERVLEFFRLEANRRRSRKSYRKKKQLSSSLPRITKSTG